MYGTGSGSDRAPTEVGASMAPGRYRSRYRTNSIRNRGSKRGVLSHVVWTNCNYVEAVSSPL